jgi:hypothetical protein
MDPPPGASEEAAMSIAHVLICASVTTLLLAAPTTHAQGGLRVDDGAQASISAWPRWQARLGLITTSPVAAGTSWQLSAGQLLGDYYWSGLRPAGVGRSGGFRATSGLLLGQRSLALGMPAQAAANGSGLSLSRTIRLSPAAGDIHEALSAVPYVGVGYSGIALSRGWGFTADVGLAGAGGLRPRRDGALGSQGVDDLLRELRLTPVLQFGASYAF